MHILGNVLQHVGMGYVEQLHRKDSQSFGGFNRHSTERLGLQSSEKPFKQPHFTTTIPLLTSEVIAPQMHNFQVQNVKVQPMTLYRPSGHTKWLNQEVCAKTYNLCMFGSEQNHTAFTAWIWICPPQKHPLIVPYHLWSCHTIWHVQDKNLWK